MKKRNYILFAIALVFLFNTTVSADCLLGSDTAKDLYGALKIFRIAAPLMVVFLTVVDMIKMLSSGLNPDKGGKEAPPPKAVFSRFVKRLLAALLLFIIPTLVDIVFQWAGVWDADHTCTSVLTDGNYEATASDSDEPSSTECASHAGDQSACEAAGCTYNSKNKCIMKN